MSRLVSPARAAGLFAAAAVFAACAGDPVSVPSNLVARADVVTNAPRTMTLCKTGPAGTYTFDLVRSGNTDNTGDIFLNSVAGNSGTVSLTVSAQTPTPCTTVYTRVQADNESSDGIVNVLITEQAAAGTTLADIISASGVQAPAENIPGRNVSLALNAYHDASATFVNAAAARGCSYTLGWYKNKGKATIAGLKLNGVLYLDVLNTQPNGNPYYILAHQYIAATMNAANASTTPAVDAALAAGTQYFGLATAGSPYPINPNTGVAYTKAELTGWSTTLDNYNNGLIGPGHCD